MLYLVTYDLHRPVQDYQELYAAIRDLGEHIKPMNNIWIVDSSQNGAVIRDTLKVHVDVDDVLFVTRVTGWASYRFDSNDAEWLKSNS